MNKTKVRLAEPRDTEDFLRCEFATQNNLFDPNAGLYPASFTLVAERDRPIVYLPVQPMFMMESLGINPDADKREVAVALAALTRDLSARAEKIGMGEIGFFCSDESTQEFAEAHGFEKIPFPFYRLKVKNCE